VTVPEPRIAGKHTRADLGMRSPRSVSRNITPGQGGSTVHWGGAGSTITSHSTCRRIWLGWQDFHMDSRGWVDIAYTMGFCQHGWVFPGRGYGVRTAAQGSNMGNDISYAFVHINERNVLPSPEALSALAWLVADARRAGGAGMRVWPHSAWHSTSCPGSGLLPAAKSLDRQPIGQGAESPVRLPASGIPPFPLGAGEYFGRHGVGHIYYSDALRPWQRQMAARGWRINVNGYVDDNCLRVIVAFQREKGLGVDGMIGPKTWAAAWTAPIT
jgi:peptidoglycan hydrolase-like protein with peptidoglycan-binding domain